jgi:protein-disulfide isomerase
MKCRSIVMLWVGLQSGFAMPLQASTQSNPPQTAPTTEAATNGSAAPDATRQQLDEILKELLELRSAQEKQRVQLAEITANGRPHAKISMNVDHDWHATGNANAPVTVVEFTDLECPFCQRFENVTLPTLKANYIDSGKIQFVGMDLPLSMHSDAQQAAEAAQCAGDQGKFWELRVALFGHADAPTGEVVLDSAKSLGLDLKQFQSCLDTNKYHDRVAAEVDTAAALDIHATPTFVIGHIIDGKLTGIKLEGALDYSRFKSEIDKLLQDR